MKPLLVQVDDIRESAQPWEAVLAREDLDEMLLGDHPTEFHAAGPATAQVRLTRMGKKVLVQGSFQVPLSGQCKRCLKDVTLGEPIDLTLTYVPAAREPKRHEDRPGGDKPGSDAEQRHGSRHQRDEEGAAGSFEIETADEEVYSGQSIDLAPALREQVLLATPPSPLCSEDCKGLCAICGQDKNLRDCGCSAARIDPRWEALKRLQLSSSETNLKPTGKE